MTNRPTACQDEDCAPVTTALARASWLESAPVRAASRPGCLHGGQLGRRRLVQGNEFVDLGAAQPPAALAELVEPGPFGAVLGNKHVHVHAWRLQLGYWTIVGAKEMRCKSEETA